MNITATDAQTGFIRTLMAERDYSGLNAKNIEDRVQNGPLSKVDASTLISMLMACPKVAQKNLAAAEEGFYILSGSVYRVQKAKQSGNRYAKVLVTSLYGKANWEYAPGMVTKLATAEKLTKDVAAEMGHRYGVCMVCGRTLTAEGSVDAGIGPICASKI